MAETNKEKASLKKEIKDWIQIIGAAIIIAFVLNTFIIANSDVPSPSMEPTIMTHSRIIGSRLNYHFTDIERGDIAIFIFGWRCPVCREVVEGEKKDGDSCPFCNSAVNGRAETIFYVKRVIGLSGDIIDIKDDKVFINGSKEPLEEPYLAEKMGKHETLHFEVPENSYFMMGDNRNNSYDARYWNNHYIARDKVIAQVLFEYYPQIKVLR